MHYDVLGLDITDSCINKIKEIQSFSVTVLLAFIIIYILFTLSSSNVEDLADFSHFSRHRQQHQCSIRLFWP